MGALASIMFEGGLFTKGKSNSSSSVCTSCPSKALCGMHRPNSVSVGGEAFSWELIAQPQSICCGTMAQLPQREPSSACARSSAGHRRITTKLSAGPVAFTQQKNRSASRMRVRRLHRLARGKTDLFADFKSVWPTGSSMALRQAARNAPRPEI